ncbi:hypothetical protein [Azohydromonas sediminis]|uniref:hypothetical protein n=1 Tax=Azohydromonas sediminis TaxID=2259674 RepID=UPI001F2AE8B2|nr:hypothetical protein [Azohydromonas sediminis]
MPSEMTTRRTEHDHSSTPAGRPLTRRALTPREEAYAVARASGAPAIDAFLGAYNWTGKRDNARQQAAAVEGRERVARRIQELRDQYAKAAVEASRGTIECSRTRAYTMADAMTELDMAMEMASTKENPMAMIKVVEVRMKLYGLGIGEARNPVNQPEITYEQAVELLEEIRAFKSR